MSTPPAFPEFDADETQYLIGNFTTGSTASIVGPFQEINESFLLSSAYLVFFMHCGFAMVSDTENWGTLLQLRSPYASFCLSLQLSVGCVRAKFAKHIAILILVDATASALGFYLFGYAFAYGDEATSDSQPAGNGFIGKNFFGMHQMPPSTYYSWVFQWTVSLIPCPCAGNLLPMLLPTVLFTCQLM